MKLTQIKTQGFLNSKKDLYDYIVLLSMFSAIIKITELLQKTMYFHT